jgi:hypothetical protein
MENNHFRPVALPGVGAMDTLPCKNPFRDQKESDRYFASHVTARQTLRRSAARCVGEGDSRRLKTDRHIENRVAEATKNFRSQIATSDNSILKAVILKPCTESTGEPGVVIISFEYEWAKLLCSPHLPEFARCYRLVVSPTWTPPHSTLNCLFPKIFP